MAELSALAFENQNYQVKIMQCFLALYADYTGPTSTLLTKVTFSTCLNLLGNTGSQVKEIVFATTRQLAIHLFDRAMIHNKEKNSSDQSYIDSKDTGVANDAIFLFKDICALINGSSPSFLELSNIPHVYGAALLESILSESVEYFKEHESIFPTIKYALCPFIIRSLSEAEETHNLYHRVVRLTHAIVKNYYSGLVIETEIFFSALRSAITSPSMPILNRVLAAEAICSLLPNPKILELIYVNYKNDDKVFDIFSNVLPDPTYLLLSAAATLDVSNKLNKLLSMEDLPSKLKSAFSQSSRTSYLDVLERSDAPEVADTYFVALACDYTHIFIESLCKMTILDSSYSEEETCDELKLTFFSKILDKLEIFFANVLKLSLPQNNSLLLLTDIHSLGIVIWKQKSIALRDQYLKMTLKIFKDTFLRTYGIVYYNKNFPEYVKVMLKRVFPEVDNYKVSDTNRGNEVEASHTLISSIFLIEKTSSFSSAFGNTMSVSQWEWFLDFMELISNMLGLGIAIPKDIHGLSPTNTPSAPRKHQKRKDDVQLMTGNSNISTNQGIDPILVHHFEVLSRNVILETNFHGMLRIIKAAHAASIKLIALLSDFNTPESRSKIKELQIKCFFYIKLVWSLASYRSTEIIEARDEDPYFIITLMLAQYSNNHILQKVGDFARRAHISITSSFVSSKYTDPNVGLNTKILASIRLMGLHKVVEHFEYSGQDVWERILSLPIEVPLDLQFELHRHIWILKSLRILTKITTMFYSHAKELFRIIEDCSAVYTPSLCATECEYSIIKPLKLTSSTEKNYHKLSRLIYSVIKDCLCRTDLPQRLELMERARCILLSVSIQSTDFYIVVNFMHLLYVLTQNIFEVYIPNSESERRLNISNIRACCFKEFNYKSDVLKDICTFEKNISNYSASIDARNSTEMDNLLRNFLYTILKYTFHYSEKVRLLAFDLILDLLDQHSLTLHSKDMGFHAIDILIFYINYFVGLPPSVELNMVYNCRCANTWKTPLENPDAENPPALDNLANIILRTSNLISKIFNTLSEPHSGVALVCEKMVDIAEKCFYSHTQDVSVASFHALETVLNSTAFENPSFRSTTTRAYLKIIETFNNITRSPDNDTCLVLLPSFYYNKDKRYHVGCTRYLSFVLVGVFTKAYNALSDDLFLSNFDTSSEIILNLLTPPILITATGAPQLLHGRKYLQPSYTCVPSHPYKKVDDFLNKIFTCPKKRKLGLSLVEKTLNKIRHKIELINENFKVGFTDLLLLEYLQINYVSIAEQSMDSLERGLEFIRNHPEPHVSVPLSSIIYSIIRFMGLEVKKVVANNAPDQPRLIGKLLCIIDGVISTLIISIDRNDISTVNPKIDFEYIHNEMISPYSALIKYTKGRAADRVNLYLTDEDTMTLLNAARKIISYFCQTSNTSDDLQELYAFIKILIDLSTVYFPHKRSCYKPIDTVNLFDDAGVPYFTVLPNRNLSRCCYDLVADLCSRYKNSNERHIHAASGIAARELYKVCKDRVYFLVENLKVYDGIPLDNIQYMELSLILETLLRTRIVPGSLVMFFPDGSDKFVHQAAKNSEFAHLLLLAPDLSDLCQVILHGADRLEDTHMFGVPTYGVNNECATVYLMSKKCLQVVWEELGIRG